MNCEEIRLKKGEAFCKYLAAPIEEKIYWLGVWKSYCLMYEDAYAREVKGEIPHDSSQIGLPENYKLLPNH